MGVNFIPNIKGMKPFRFWCQTVLPLVYDDSLSYYELLCKVVSYINGLLNDNQELIEAYTKLQDYVNNYFDELDIEEEVNRKLDEMAIDGTLTNMIRVYVDPYIQAQQEYNTNTRNYVNESIERQNNKIENLFSLVGSPLTAETVSQMTDTDKIYVYVGNETGYTNGNWYYYDGENWVSGGVYNAQAIETDKTLTVSDKAADAKTVGDQLKIIKSLNDSYVNLESMIYPDTTRNNVTFVSGTYNGIPYCRATGSATDEIEFNIIMPHQDSLPAWFIPGDEIYITMPNRSGVKYNFRCWKNENEEEIFSFNKSGKLRIPLDTVGLYLQMVVESGTVIDNDLFINISNALTNKELSNDYNNYVSEKKYNSYNVGEEDIIYPNTTRDGIAFRKIIDENGLAEIYITGTSTARDSINIVTPNNTSVPEWITPGIVQYAYVPYVEGISYVIHCYDSDDNRIARITIDRSRDFIVPKKTVWTLIQLVYENGYSFNNTSYFRVLNTMTNAELSETAVDNSINRKYNSYIVSEEDIIYPITTRDGLTFALNDTGTGVKSIIINGTSTASDSINLIVGSLTTKPSWLTPETRQFADIPFVQGLYYLIHCYNSSGTRIARIQLESSKSFVIPNGTVGVYIQLVYENNITLNNAETYFRVLNALPNYKIGEGYSTPENVTYNIYNNTTNYTGDVTPTLVTNSDFYLESTNDSTDRTQEILALLQNNGYCRLGKGTFYVSNLTMPANSKLEGSGYGSILRLSDSVTDGFAVSVRDYCQLSNMMIGGGATSGQGNTTSGTRHGIVFQGTLNGQGNPTNVPRRSNIENVYIINFSGSGLLCQYTSTESYTSLMVNNLWVENCFAGINIFRRSEYSHFTNCRALTCRYGLINNGGNNYFVNCDFSRNTNGVLMDNEDGLSYNNSHASMVGCSINHSGNNTGYALILKGLDYGFIFSGINIFYGNIVIENCKGIVIDAMNSGHITNIDVSNSPSVIVSHSIFTERPIVTKPNSNIYSDLCMIRDTGDVFTL